MDEEDRILYNKKSGVASWDKDGSGKAKAVEFAILDTSPDKLSAKDFLVDAESLTQKSCLRVCVVIHRFRDDRKG